jgi:hypothetical protein
MATMSPDANPTSSRSDSTKYVCRFETPCGSHVVKVLAQTQDADSDRSGSIPYPQIYAIDNNSPAVTLGFSKRMREQQRCKQVVQEAWQLSHTRDLNLLLRA